MEASNAILYGEMENWFTYEPATPEQVVRYAIIREAALDFARVVFKHTPPGPEQTAALWKLRECMLLANVAVAGSMHIIDEESGGLSFSNARLGAFKLG